MQKWADKPISFDFSNCLARNVPWTPKCGRCHIIAHTTQTPSPHPSPSLFPAPLHHPWHQTTHPQHHTALPALLVDAWFDSVREETLDTGHSAPPHPSYSPPCCSITWTMVVVLCKVVVMWVTGTSQPMPKYGNAQFRQAVTMCHTRITFMKHSYLVLYNISRSNVL